MRVGCEGGGEGVREEGLVVRTQRLGLRPFGAGGGRGVAVLALGGAREGEARVPWCAAREVEGPGFHVCVVRAPFENGRAARLVVVIKLLYHRSVFVALWLWLTCLLRSESEPENV